MKNLSTILKMKRMFAGVLLLAMGFTFSESAAQCVTPPSGLVSWWPGEGNANDIIASNHGTLQNGVSFAPGKVGNAFSFDGVDDGISILKSSDLNLGAGDFTITAWVKFTVDFPGSGDVEIFLNYAGINYYSLMIEADGERAAVGFRDGNSNHIRLVGTTSLNDGQWHFLTGLRNGTSGLIYVDGILEGSTTNPAMGSINTGTCLYARIGAIHSGPGHCTSPSSNLSEPHFNGLIDELDIYNRALSASEIQSIYNAGSAGKCTNTPPPVCVNPPSGLVSWWPGDDNTNDIKSNNHGTLQNGAAFASGKVDQAFSFDGVDDYVSVPDNTDWDLSMNDFTIDFWVNFDQIKESMFIHQESGATFGGFEFDYQAHIGSLVFSWDGHGVFSRTWSPLTNRWYHLAVTRTSGAYRMYVDGAQLGSDQFDSNPIADVTGNLRIGSWSGGAHYTVDGRIDELDVFNRALTAQEIADIYNAGSAGKCKECTPPEVSITGNDPVFTGTTHTYTATTDAANPSFEWSVTGGTINSNSNSSVSITVGAVGTMIVSVNVTDGVTNCSKEETKNVTVNPPPAGSSEVVFATNSVWLKEHANILSGNVIVNNASSGPVLDSQVELSVGQSVTTPAGFALKAHRVKVKQGAVVESEVFYNELSNNGTINGSQNSSLTLPVFASLPPFHQAPAGTQDITVNQNESITLTAGAYRDIFIKQNGTIIFTGGGTFALRSLNTGAKAKLLFDSPTEILIEGKLDTDENSYVGPQSGSGIGAADIVFYIAASNGNNGNFGATPKAAQLGLKNAVLANFYVPNGTLWLRQGTVAAGAFLGRDVIVGEQVQVTLESAFAGGSSLAKSANDKGDKKQLISTAIPEAFALLQNYPNPFNPSTVINFALSEAGVVQLSIYNLHGQEVRTLINGQMNVGFHAVNWDGKDERGQIVPSGVYLYKLRVNGFAQTRKMIFMK